MPNPGPQGSHRKSLAVKHLDGEPLSRADLQYDFLFYLFNNTRAVFTDPFPTIHGTPAGTKVTFRDLYVNSLVQSSRCSKVTKERLVENPVFGDEFAKISLLSNVGRINTTMACPADLITYECHRELIVQSIPVFPEMRTNLRTYHPVPSLQKSDGNLQDAPRIKNILKSCLLPTEQPNEQLTPADVLARSRSGHVPPTTIVNLIFVFAANSSIIAQSHFSGQTEHDLLDFFSPINISSESRVQAFLWLCFHYLEGPVPNPFDDQYSLEHANKVPKLNILSPEEALLENVDPPDEKEWGEKMTLQRKEFMANKDKTPEPGAEGSQGAKGKERARGRGRGGRKKSEKKVAASISQSHVLPKAEEDEDEIMSEASLMQQSHPMDLSTTLPPVSLSQPLSSPTHHGSVHPPHSASRASSPFEEALLPRSQFPSHRSSRLPSPRPSQAELRSAADPYPRPLSSPPPTTSTHGKPVRQRTRKRREGKSGKTQQAAHYVSEFPLTHLPPASRSQKAMYVAHDARTRTPTTPAPHRSTLEQAFHVVMNSDPLEDSEDEEALDENTRSDLLLRLRIISRLRGKEPTPEREIPRFHSHSRYARY